MYYAMRASAPSLHRESTDSLIYTKIRNIYIKHNNYYRNSSEHVHCVYL